jgi:hypothetical protein
MKDRGEFSFAKGRSEGQSGLHQPPDKMNEQRPPFHIPWEEEDPFGKEHPTKLLRHDYERMGILPFVPVDIPSSLGIVDKNERLDPNPSADEKAFWDSPLGIDGWQPDFRKHHFPHWHEYLDQSSLMTRMFDEEHQRDSLEGYNTLKGQIETAAMPQFRFSATNLTPYESARLKHRMDNLCPLQDLKTIAENCQASTEASANPSHCWLEKTLYITCSEFKKRYLNNRQRFFYIYGSIKDDLRTPKDPDRKEQDDKLDPDILNQQALYVLRWEFYRLQYKEGKRNIFMRQMKNYKPASWQSFWTRLITPSTWLTLPAPAPHAPKHVKNYIFRGHHWLSPRQLGVPALPIEQFEESVYGQMLGADSESIAALEEDLQSFSSERAKVV